MADIRNITDDSKGYSIAAFDHYAGIEGSSGNDSLYADGYKSLFIEGGKGNDYINLTDTLKSSEKAQGGSSDTPTPVTADTGFAFHGNLNANSPIITAIGQDTVTGHFADTETDGTLILELSDGTSKVATTGSYKIGHSVPVTMTLQVYDSLGMVHSIPIQLEKVAANQWEASLSNIFGKTSTLNSDAEAKALEAYYTYIEESDGTYTRVQILQRSDEKGSSESFANAASFTVHFEEYGATVGDLTARLNLDYNYKPIYGEDDNGNRVVTSYEKIGGEDSTDTSSSNSTDPRPGIDTPDEEGYIRKNAADSTTTNINFKDISQYVGNNSAFVNDDGDYGIIVQPVPSIEIDFSGNVNAAAPIITAIGVDTVVGHFGDTTTDGTLILALGDGTSKAATTGSYTIGHSVPVSMIMTIYDSQGMAHNVPVKLEKVAANSWEVSFENIFGKTSTLNSYTDIEALENYYTYIEESDGTYTRIQILQKSDEEPAEGASESYTNAASFTVHFDENGQAIGDLTARINLDYNYKPIYGEDDSGNRVITGYQKIGGDDDLDTISTDPIAGIEVPDEEGYIRMNGADTTTASANFKSLSQYAGINSAHIKTADKMDMVIPAAATTEINFSGNVNSESLTITAIGQDTVSGHFGDTTTDGALNLTLSNGSVISASRGSYTIGHSIPLSTIVQVYDSEGKAHSVTIQLEKVGTNTWQASLANIFGKSSTLNSDEKVEALESYYAYILEDDGTYTRVQMLQKSDEEPAEGESESFANAASFTVHFDSTGQTIGDLTARLNLDYNYKPIYGEDESGNIVVTGYEKIGGEDSTDTSFSNSTNPLAGIDTPDEEGYIRMNGADPTTASINFKGLSQLAESNSAYPTADGDVAILINNVPELDLTTINYANGDGNDTITSWEESNLIYLTNATSYSASVSGNDVILTVGSGSILIKGAKNKLVTVRNMNNRYSYNVYTGNNTISAIANDYNNSNSTSNIMVNGTNNADYIYNNLGNTIIESGNGNDTIKDYAHFDNITAGNGDDYIYSGYVNSIIGGSGNDTIELAGGYNTIQYANGDGNDVIIGYNDTDVIKILEDSSYSTTKSGNDVIIKVGSGRMTLKNAKGKTLNISGGTYDSTSGDDVIEQPLPTGLTYNKDKKALTASNKFTGSEIDLNNYASTVVTLNAASAKSAQNLIGNDNNNLIKGSAKNDTLSGGDGDDTLTGGKGKDVFIYDGQGDDVITDYTTGQDTIIIADDEKIIDSTFNGKDVILTVGDSSSDIIGSIKVKNAKGKQIVVNRYDFDDDYVYNDAVSMLYGNGSATILSNKTDNINKNGLVTMLDLSKATEGQEIDSNYSIIVKASNKNDTIFVSSTVNGTIYGNAGNDSIRSFGKDSVIDGGKGNDTIISYHNLTNNTLTGGAGKDLFQVLSGARDTITDYTAGQDSIQVYSFNPVYSSLTGATIDGNDLILKSNVVNSKLTLKNVVTKDKKGNINGKKITFVDYYGNATSQVYGTPTLNVANGDGSTINASIAVNKDIVTVIDASKRNNKNPITIIGNGLNDLLKGGAGSDTIIAGSGDDTLTGNKGKDLFVYTGEGKDIITDYTVDQDMIQLNVGSAANYSVNGKDVIFNVDENNFLTVKNGKDKKMTVIDSTGTVTSIFNDITEKVFAKTDKDTLYNAATDSDVIMIDATKLTKAIYITGNDNDNTIKGSAKNDTINGGIGNDLLTGGKGNDLFIYSGGNDTITDYTVGQDKIKIDTSLIFDLSNEAFLSGNDVMFKISAKGNYSQVNYLTIKNAKGKKLDIIDSNGYKMTLIRNDTGKGTTAYLTDDSNDGISLHKNTDASKCKKGVTLLSGDGGNGSLKGGSGNDTLVGDRDDTLTGGKGNDIFQYWYGNPVITDYTANQDIIKFSSSHSITDSKISGKDVILTLGSAQNSSLGSIKVKNGKGKQISISNKNDKETDEVIITTTQIFGNSTSTLIATSDVNIGELTSINLINMVDASKAKSAIKITNGNTAYTIKGSNYADSLIGGTADDTFIGGKGDDTLSGDAGADVFVYNSGDGNDVIVDFTSNDKIKLGNKSTTINEKKSGVSGDDYVLTIGKNTITLIDAANTAITVVDSKGNSKTYNSQASYLEREYFTDENFSSMELDSILDNSSNLISNDYNYDFNHTLNKQLSQTLLTNSPKQPK